MEESKYGKQIAEARDTMVIVGDILVVERIEQQASKLIYMEAPKDAPMLCHVLAAGEGYVDEDGTGVPCDTKPGSIVLLGHTSVKWFSTLPIEGYSSNTVGVARESEVQIRWDSIEKFREYTRRLNGSKE